MLGLPKNSEILKQLPKKSIYTKFNLLNADRVKFDNDISKLYIVHELSSETINIKVGEKISSIYVLLVELKSKNFNEKNIKLIAKMIPQTLVFILRFEGQEALAVFYEGRIFKSDWAKIDELTLTISGLNFDVVFENFVKQIGEIVVKDCETLSLQLAINETRQKIVKEIEKLNKKIATQKQPHKKFALMEGLGKLKKELSKV